MQPATTLGGRQAHFLKDLHSSFVITERPRRMLSRYLSLSCLRAWIFDILTLGMT